MGSRSARRLHEVLMTSFAVIRVLIPSLVNSRDSNGWLQGVVWEGDSEDLTDDGHRTIGS